MEEKVLDIIEEIYDDTLVRTDLDLDLFASGILDSLGFINLLVEIEDNFNIRISPSEVNRDDINTPNKIINLINARSSLS